VPLDLPRYRQQLTQLADQGIFIGTSSWKYPGWCGLIYDEQRYLTRSKFSDAKFNRECLADYAETFRTVCVDAGYYQFPTESYVGELCGQVPDGFKFASPWLEKTTNEVDEFLFRIGDLEKEPKAPLSTSAPSPSYPKTESKRACG